MTFQHDLHGKVMLEPLTIETREETPKASAPA